MYYPSKIEMFELHFLFVFHFLQSMEDKRMVK